MCRQGVERTLRVMCARCVCCARLRGCAHPSHALLRGWQPKGSSLRCHCTARVPSPDAASSRAGIVCRVQSITKAFVVQAYIRLDLCTAHTCGCMIAPFMLKCNPDERNA